MSVVTDSPVHSSSSDDFAAYLDDALDAGSPNSSSSDENGDDEFQSVRYFSFINFPNSFNFVRYALLLCMTCLQLGQVYCGFLIECNGSYMYLLLPGGTDFRVQI